MFNMAIFPKQFRLLPEVKVSRNGPERVPIKELLPVRRSG